MWVFVFVRSAGIFPRHIGCFLLACFCSLLENSVSFSSLFLLVSLSIGEKKRKRGRRRRVERQRNCGNWSVNLLKLAILYSEATRTESAYTAAWHTHEWFGRGKNTRGKAVGVSLWWRSISFSHRPIFPVALIYNMYCTEGSKGKVEVTRNTLSSVAGRGITQGSPLLYPPSQALQWLKSVENGYQKWLTSQLNG